ncbi:uncharacterized protein LOC127105446 [Lathyrus oleraceus]|uniref:Plant bHLH transcription factor ACT-like domain-containing protein n=1 Tax=Pisum sativum TaxID=3888 RepID=A0A9D4VLG2_PEA|nr:uncharacterized protein LOC127105446 [Pisum sativum]KAI5384901.1 hypothetical protein KIW84_071764 [Pisum sativum]
MACKVQKRVSLRRRLHILRFLTNSNYNKLKVALENVKREYENLIATRRDYIRLLDNNVNDNKDVKIVKISEGTFMVKVTCEKGGGKLVAILEAFEEICVNVEEAKVSCENEFSMEAIIVSEDQSLDVTYVTEVILKAIEK